jgi:hypothetical protein
MNAAGRPLATDWETRSSSKTADATADVAADTRGVVVAAL